ncbi:hypothetical protein HCH52_12115 [Oscillospiraceae bacterium HV4-5-C5C]|nr:hypothetical protein [Oscillospiraceae bacterium HV4-5-C5C]
MYDKYYDGVIADASDSSDFSEWFDISSDAYSEWFDSHSETYSLWLESHSNLYASWLGIKSAFWGGDFDIDTILETSQEETTESASETETETTMNDVAETDPVSEENEGSDEIRPDFKAAMDSYEAFYDGYCEFMVKYQDNPSDLALLTEYADMMTQAADMDEKFSAWESDDLNDEELKYYLDVNTRIQKKLIDVVPES